MKINVCKKNSLDVETIIIPVTQKLEIKADICELQKKIIIEYIEAKLFEGKIGEIYSFARVVNNTLVHTILVGLGENPEKQEIFEAIGGAIQKAQELKTINVRINLDNIEDIITREVFTKVVLSSRLAEYKYEPFKTVGKKTVDIENLEIITSFESEENLLEEAMILSDAIIEARNLTNTPANILKPTQLGEKAILLGAKYGFEVRVLGKTEIESLNMKAFLAVAQGSDSEPKLIIMEYKGSNKEEKLAIVGKGLTYDSGGYSIKPTDSMAGMKNDMGGAAATIGAMCAIAKNKLDINVVGIVAACENMISGHAILPGDIVGSMCGKTIEISNTDAEGRLTLIDAVYYAATVEKCEKIIDLATLTGAVLVALGDQYAGVIANDKDMLAQVMNASAVSGEKIWEMPYNKDIIKINKSQIADLINSPRKKGLGCSVGGAFVGEGVEGKPWIHVDIAGMADFGEDRSYCRKGGSGFGVHLVYEFAKNMN